MEAVTYKPVWNGSPKTKAQMSPRYQRPPTPPSYHTLHTMQVAAPHGMPQNSHKILTMQVIPTQNNQTCRMRSKTDQINSSPMLL